MGQHMASLCWRSGSLNRWWWFGSLNRWITRLWVANAGCSSRRCIPDQVVTCEYRDCVNGHSGSATSANDCEGTAARDAWGGASRGGGGSGGGITCPPDRVPRNYIDTLPL